jgi:hypothetical protein
VTAVFPPPGFLDGEGTVATKGPASVRIIAAEVVAVWHRESSCKRWREVIFSGKQLEEAKEP